MHDYIFSIEMEVRDYEIDSEGIVNIPVLNRVEIDYKTPLRSGDTMVSSLWIELQGIRFIFHQDIFNKATGKMAVSAVVSCVCLEGGRLSRGEAIAEAFKDFLQS